jgi:DNA repair protein RecN (Recombination protein N)
MLTELRIRNFALIEELSLECHSGFHILTGETGAGKSILIDAIALLIGGRSSLDLIRSDADEAVLEAAFSIPPTHALRAQLRENGMLADGETELIVRRVISRTGRNRVTLNGQLATVQLLQALAGTLVDIHGQHDQQSLLSAQAQLDIVDAFGRLGDLRIEYRQAHERWWARRRELDDTLRALEQRRQQEDLLRFQHQELTDAAIGEHEEATLTSERQRLAHAHRLSELSQMVYDLLYGEEGAAVSRLTTARQSLKDLVAIDDNLRSWGEICERASVELRDLAREVQGYSRQLEQDGDRLQTVESRLDLIQRLKRKYGGSVEALLTRQQELSMQLADLDQGETRITQLRTAVEDDRSSLALLGQKLAKERKRAASKLDSRVGEELAALKMNHTRFQVELHPLEGDEPYGPTGPSRAEFLFSANPGEPLLPLARVASGGELSRVMLAMKSVLADTDQVPILIFDEVDAGVGGAVAAVMGRRLKTLSRYHQVFCITHLPQIASQADVHLFIQKKVVKGRTVTQVRQLDEAGHEAEVARMLGGTEITKAVRDTAAEMIEAAQRSK